MALLTEEKIETLARAEHDRWVRTQRSAGFVYAPGVQPDPWTHPCILEWFDPRLPDEEKDKDREAAKAIPDYLSAAGYELFDPQAS